ncbi:MAG TPA: response regulator transcription factor [Herpetosiphonaceae bacterium]|nr:response regulator transcription factor [Herpetosiphonaceae bacterium]
MENIRVLIIDDHPLFRQGICWSLSLEKDIQVIGQAENGTEAIKLTETLNPHVVLLDINLPGLNGLEVARVLKRRSPRMGIIVLSIHDDDEQLFNSIKAGAAAYASKEIDPANLVQMIRDVARGKYIINDNVMSKPHVATRVLNQFRELSNVSNNDDAAAMFAPLTSREIEILDCIARGLSNKEIANQLSISGQTVKNHITSILSKLQVNDRTMAVIHAIQQGWIKLGYDEARGRLSQAVGNAPE